MFYFMFGGIWILVSTILLVSFVFVGMPAFAIAIPSLFEIIGIIVFGMGVRKFVKNKKTNKYGIECFGKVLDNSIVNMYTNGRPEYKASILVYIENENKTEVVEEIIGFERVLYPINSYVKVKYYKGDINFIESNIKYEQLSYNAQYILKNDVIESNELDNSLDSEDEVTINGHKYRRVD